MALRSDWQVVAEALKAVRNDKCTPGKLADAEEALRRLMERVSVERAMVETLARLLAGESAEPTRRKADLAGEAGTALGMLTEELGMKG